MRKRPRLRLDDLQRDLRSAYPGLVATPVGGNILVRGTFPLTFEGELLDRFSIELELAPSFPDSVPVLREISGRIPRSPDRHTEEDGKSCPLVPEEWLLLPEEQRTVLTFLDGPVRNFFLYQALTERGGRWPWGERQHGRSGLLESYGEMLGLSDSALIPAYLGCLSRREIKGHWPCPCGSSKKLRQCHVDQLRNLHERIPPKVAASALERLKATRS